MYQCACGRLSPLSPRKKNPLCLAGPAGSGWVGMMCSFGTQAPTKWTQHWHVSRWNEWVGVSVDHLYITGCLGKGNSTDAASCVYGYLTNRNRFPSFFCHSFKRVFSSRATPNNDEEAMLFGSLLMYNRSHFLLMTCAAWTLHLLPAKTVQIHTLFCSVLYAYCTWYWWFTFLFYLW